MKAPAPTWAEREKMDSEYMHLMAELGQGQAPDVSKMGQTKSIVPRNGAQSNAPQPLLSIQHHPPNNNNNNNHNHNNNNNNNYDRYSDSPRSSNHDDWSNSPKPNDNQSGVTEEVVNGRKIIDMTACKQTPYQHPKQNNQASAVYAMQHQVGNPDEDPSQSMANQAMMYSQQMNFFAQMGMPPYMSMWPGQQMAPGYGWPMAGGAPMGAAPPPPPPPPPVSDCLFSSLFVSSQI